MTDQLHSSENKVSKEITVQCCGDISLNGPYCDPQHHEALRLNMAEVDQYLGSVDLRIANWESPLWGDGGINPLKRPRVNTTREAADCLTPLKLDVVTLANNHAFDCREKGFQNTTDFLDENGILWLGAGRSRQKAEQPLILDRKGLKLGLLDYIGLETNPNLPQDAGVFLNVLEEERTLSEIGQLANTVDVVLVHLHWGSIEMIRVANPSQRKFARRMIDAGATVIFGGHAHCVQGDEVYKAGHIYYSLGNYLFGRSGVVPGHMGHMWPKYSRNVGVAQCTLSPKKVIKTKWHYLFQEQLLLKPEDTPKRHKLQQKLSRYLCRKDSSLRHAYKREIFWQKALLPAINRIKKSGGIIGALCSIRMQHFKHILKVLSMQKNKSR